MMNPRELDVLNILWKSEEPMMATDIVEKKKDLTQSTVTAVLRKLLSDGLVEVAGITHSGRVLSRTYRPAEASRDIILQDFTENCNRFSNVIDESMICVSILTKDKAPEKVREEIKKLRELLEDWGVVCSRKS